MPRIIQGVPLATEPGISLIIFTTNEDIATKFEAHYRLIPLHFSHNERTPVQIRCNILIGVRIITEIPGSLASGTHCIYMYIHAPPTARKVML